MLHNSINFAALKNSVAFFMVRVVSNMWCKARVRALQKAPAEGAAEKAGEKIVFMLFDD